MKNSIITMLFVTALFSCKKEEQTPEIQPAPISNTEFAAFENIFEGEGVGAAVNLHEDVLILFNLDGNRYAWFEENEIKAVYNLSDSNGPLSGYDFNSVGAATTILSSNGATSLYLLDNDGDRYHVSNFDSDNIEGSFNNADAFSFSSINYELTSWGPDNTCPFNSIGAARPYSYPGNNCFDASVTSSLIHMFNGNGNEFTMYSTSGGGNFSDTEEIDNWTAENNCGGEDGLLPFDAISACCRYVTPTKIQEIFFNIDGTQMCFYNVSEGVFSEIYELY